MSRGNLVRGWSASRKRWVIGATCIGALVISLGALAAGSQTYIDPAGDAPGAPDITTVAVSNDDDGVLTFAITLADPAVLSGENAIGVLLDSDKNMATGRQGDGIDYFIGFNASAQGLFRWSGSGFVPVQSTTLTRVGASTVSINRRDLGGTGIFDFFVAALGPAPAQDVAPNGRAFWTYQLQVKPVLDSVSARFQPSAPRAGQLFTVNRVTLRLEGGRRVAPSSFSCRAKLGTSTVAPTRNCRWRIPTRSKGKRLSVTITAGYQGESATFLPFNFTVR